MIDIWEIIDYLDNTITENIYFWNPTSEQTSSFVVVNQVWWTVPFELEEKTRLEIRVIAGDTTEKFSTLKNKSQEIYNLIISYSWAFNQEIFRVVKQNHYQGFDEKNRKVFILDLMIYQVL